tara:strand:+ start:3459 stop:4010 length:552 start_codon:yes stop_codon:yes gene_type:complete
MKELIAIQSELKAPKNQRNNFGNYQYRSAEDILEALKPLLKAHNCYLTLSDELVNIGDRYYIKATATIYSEKSSVSVTAYAREEESKKGMDGSQISGASSSYSRKYSLNGLFLIDDTKDSDATNTHDKETTQVIVEKKKPVLLLNTENFGNCRKAYLKDKSNLAKICEKYEVSNEVHFALTQE